MALIATRASDGQEIESFSIPRDRWKTMQAEPKGSYRMRGTDWPAVLKRSPLGLQFFAHAPGYPGEKPEPESAHHILAKIWIAKALRAAGYVAEVEKPGESVTGEKWQADVLCQTETRSIAYEVQLAQQTLEEYERRTARYTNSDVKCIWLIGGPTRYHTFAKAVWRRFLELGMEPGDRPALPDLAAQPFLLGPNPPSEEEMKVVVFPPGRAKEIPLAEFAVGIANGKLVYSKKEWRWSG